MSMKWWRRVPVGAAAFAVSLVGVMVVGEALAIGGASACQVTDITAGTGPQSSLQMVLDAAQNGDRIQVQGHCVGNFVVTKSVFLIGEPSQAEPSPTLDGSLSGTVLTVHGAKGAAPVNVTILDLTIRNGQGSLNGGGIDSRRADLVLAGSTAVVSNEAQYGGGVFFTLGRLTLSDNATIGNNKLYGVGGWGGGVYVRKGVLSASGSAVISGNSAVTGGGVATYQAAVRLHDQVKVIDNHAANGGGGIFSYDAPVEMGGSSTVVGNDAGAHGGGVYLGGFRRGYVSLTVQGDATVHGNTSGQYGGGIEASTHGVVTVQGHAGVTENTAATGGGIATAGRVRIRNGASIGDNQAVDGGGVYVLRGRTKMAGDAIILLNNATTGGGVYVAAGALQLADGGSITLNRATADGGGLFSIGSVVFANTWAGTVCGNDPDDWPGC